MMNARSLARFWPLLLRKRCFTGTCRRAGEPASSAADGGYKSIGSFHSENLADLIQRSEENYVAPQLPFEPSYTSFPETKNTIANSSEASTTKHANPYRNDFLLDFDHWTFLNHGAFGAALAKGVHRSNDWRMYLERQPLRYFDRDLLPHLVESLRRLATFVHAPDRTNLALLHNVTSGLNAVLAGYARVHGTNAHCVVWDTTYGSVKKMAAHYFGGRVIEIPFQQKSLPKLALSDDPEAFCVQEAMELFETSLKHLDGHTNKFCFVLDHVTSNTALAMPITKLATAIKDRHPDSFILVDGAHGLLAQELDLAHIFLSGVDVYISNGHKWLSAPRGVAFLASSEDLTGSILRYPAVQSHGVDEQDLFSRFVWDGCRDYSAALSLPVVLDHWTNPESVRERCKEVLRKGIFHLGEVWHGIQNTEELAGTVTLMPLSSNLLSLMCLVRIPGDDKSYTSTDAKQLQDDLYSHNIEVPIKCINNELYARVSCHTYNTEDDFGRLATVVRSKTLS
jgi:selenocysteine lyase/cysteine desulfurase